LNIYALPAIIERFVNIVAVSLDRRRVFLVRVLDASEYIDKFVIKMTA
jgi:hypothetical protein